MVALIMVALKKQILAEAFSDSFVASFWN